MRLLPLRYLPSSLSLLLRRPLALALAAAAALAVAGHWALVLATLDPAGQSTVLHYNAYFGIDRIGTWRGALEYPAAATVILALDLAAAAWLMRRDHWLAQGAVAAAAVSAALLLATSAAVRYQFS